MENLVKCPFCKGTDIRYSIRATGRFDLIYHAAFYCNTCHCYGPRVLSVRVDHYDYKKRSEKENDPGLQKIAADAWNRCAPKRRS